MTTFRLLDEQKNLLTISNSYQKFRSLVYLIKMKPIIMISGVEEFRYFLIGMLEQNTKYSISCFSSELEMLDFISNSSKAAIESTTLILHLDESRETLPNKELRDISKPIISVNMKKPQFIEEINIL